MTNDKEKKATEFGKRLRETRKAKNLGLLELADILGTRYQTIQNYECGKRYPKPETIERFANALDVSPQYLMAGEDFSDDVIYLYKSELNENQLMLIEYITNGNNQKTVNILASYVNELNKTNNK